MIPSDLSTRLRMLTEASFFGGEPSVAPLARATPISAQLPELAPGQRIIAHLQHGPAADNTYQAQVGGRDITLSLPAGVKAGDTLALIVRQVTPEAVFATVTEAHPGELPGPLSPQGAEAASSPALSQTGKLISFLLTGQPATAPPQLNAGEPLLPTAPQTAAATAELTARLGAAVTESGLFYEAHQALWLAGKVDTAALQKEPQGRTPATPPAVAEAAPRSSETPAPSAAATSSATTTGVAASASSSVAAAQSGSAPPVADKLLPLVHQQLDTLASHQMAWQGQIWPGQTMEWEIEDPAGREHGADGEPSPYWNTTLRLTLPSLGGVEARLQLTPAGIAVRLITDNSTTRDALAAGEEQLANALAAADVPLTGLVAELAPLP